MARLKGMKSTFVTRHSTVLHFNRSNKLRGNCEGAAIVCESERNWLTYAKRYVGAQKYRTYPHPPEVVNSIFRARWPIRWPIRCASIEADLVKSVERSVTDNQCFPISATVHRIQIPMIFTFLLRPRNRSHSIKMFRSTLFRSV